MAFKYYEGQRVRIKTRRQSVCYYNGMETDISFRYQSPVLGYYYRLDGYGMWFHEDELEPVCTEKIVIMSDGVTTTAKRYDGKKVIKEARAVCSKDDVFNFEVGAGIAMDRLIGREEQQKIATNIADYLRGISTKYLKHRGKIIKDIEGFAKGAKPKLYNGKVVCADPSGFPYYTKGKIYEVKDGLFFNDDGIPIPCFYRLSSFDDLQRDSVATWLEVVE